MKLPTKTDVKLYLDPESKKYMSPCDFSRIFGDCVWTTIGLVAYIFVFLLPGTWAMDAIKDVPVKWLLSMQTSDWLLWIICSLLVWICMILVIIFGVFLIQKWVNFYGPFSYKAKRKMKLCKIKLIKLN